MSTFTAADLAGLWVPIVTPFDQTGAIDQPSLCRLADRLLLHGAAGIAALGTTGEPATLDDEERRRVVAVCATACADADRPLIVGAGSNSTNGTIAEIEMLCRVAPIDAALVVVPYYTRPSELAIVEHFQIVADSSPVPIVAYNVPYRTGRGLGADAILRLARHERIIGIKQAVGCLDRDTLEVLRHEVPDFALLAGDDAFIGPTVLMGGRGAIAAAAHLCTSLFAELIAAAQRGDVARAAANAHRLLPVVDAGFAEPNPAVWKGALCELGDIATGTVRRPLVSASAGVVDDLVRAVRAVQGP